MAGYAKSVVSIPSPRYTSDHVSGYVAEVTYEGEARPYVAPPKPAYPATL